MLSDHWERHWIHIPFDPKYICFVGFIWKILKRKLDGLILFSLFHMFFSFLFKVSFENFICSDSTSEKFHQMAIWKGVGFWTKTSGSAHACLCETPRFPFTPRWWNVGIATCIPLEILIRCSEMQIKQVPADAVFARFYVMETDIFSLQYILYLCKKSTFIHYLCEIDIHCSGRSPATHETNGL